MKTSVNLYDFRNAFQRIRPENFSYDGLEALYNYLAEIEDSTGDEIELDVIALCCDYSEMTIEDAIEDYADFLGFDPSGDEDDDCAAFLDMLRDHTAVIMVDDESMGMNASIIIQSF